MEDKLEKKRACGSGFRGIFSNRAGIVSGDRGILYYTLCGIFSFVSAADGTGTAEKRTSGWSRFSGRTFCGILCDLYGDCQYLVHGGRRLHGKSEQLGCRTYCRMY